MKNFHGLNRVQLYMTTVESPHLGVMRPLCGLCSPRYGDDALKDLTPELERVLGDILGTMLRSGFRGSPWTADDLERFKERIEYYVKR